MCVCVRERERTKVKEKMMALAPSQNKLIHTGVLNLKTSLQVYVKSMAETWRDFIGFPGCPILTERPAP